MSPYDFEIGLDFHKEFSMLAILNKNGECLRFDRLEKNTAILDHCFGAIKALYPVTFEIYPQLVLAWRLFPGTRHWLYSLQSFAQSRHCSCPCQERQIRRPHLSTSDASRTDGYLLRS